MLQMGFDLDTVISYMHGLKLHPGMIRQLESRELPGGMSKNWLTAVQRCNGKVVVCFCWNFYEADEDFKQPQTVVVVDICTDEIAWEKENGQYGSNYCLNSSSQKSRNVAASRAPTECKPEISSLFTATKRQSEASVIGENCVKEAVFQHYIVSLA